MKDEKAFKQSTPKTSRCINKAKVMQKKINKLTEDLNQLKNEIKDYVGDKCDGIKFNDQILASISRFELTKVDSQMLKEKFPKIYFKVITKTPVVRLDIK